MARTPSTIGKKKKKKETKKEKEARLRKARKSFPKRRKEVSFLGFKF